MFADENMLPEDPRALEAKNGPADLEVRDLRFAYEDGAPVLSSADGSDEVEVPKEEPFQNDVLERSKLEPTLSEFVFRAED